MTRRSPGELEDSGDRALTLNHFVGSMSPAEATELRRMLDRRRHGS